MKEGYSRVQWSTTTRRDVVGVAQHGSQQQQKLYDGFPEHIAAYGSLNGVT